jgi:hypothetical protein
MLLSAGGSVVAAYIVDVVRSVSHDVLYNGRLCCRSSVGGGEGGGRGERLKSDSKMVLYLLV